mmetsp:Transcript_24211/g.71283  ORF Transcript_24211/g.71283 Transcript_24211/m.71283 type:complete len:124 (-) Transcript_24211:243-614(-)
METATPQVPAPQQVEAVPAPEKEDLATQTPVDDLMQVARDFNVSTFNTAVFNIECSKRRLETNLTVLQGNLTNAQFAVDQLNESSRRLRAALNHGKQIDAIDIMAHRDIEDLLSTSPAFSSED